MKAEINNENKAKFFALYWGQEVLSDITNLGERKLYPIVPSNMYRIEESHLELKPISSISDEDAISLADFLKIEYPENGWRKNIKYLIDYVDSDDCSYILIDWLRSKGYALPWMRLSVEEMTEAGWIKLVE